MSGFRAIRSATGRPDWLDAPVNTPQQCEIEQAFADYQAAVAGIVDSGDWASFADLFTEDATYEEHAFGTFTGREAIRSWVVETMTAFPGQHHDQLPDRLARRGRADQPGHLRGAQPDARPGRRIAARGEQPDDPHLRRRRAVVARGGRLQPDAVRPDVPGLGDGGPRARAAQRGRAGLPRAGSARACRARGNVSIGSIRSSRPST